MVAAVIGLLFLDHKKARKIRVCKEGLGPLGFFHLPVQTHESRRLGFSFLLPKTPVTLHFQRRKAKGPEEHFVEVIESRGKHYRYFAVLARRYEGLSLPVFYLRPETVADAFAASLGMNDIDLPGQHLFSTTFHLSGTDKRAVRNLFRGKLAAALAPRRRWWVAGAGEWLILHRRRGVRQGEVADFVRDARGLALAFVEAAGGSPPDAPRLRPASLMPDNPAPPKSPEKGH